jgi:hypothetical protein
MFLTIKGLLGEYFGARHSYGHYRSCAVTGSYIQVAGNPWNFESLIKGLQYALYRTIKRHAALSYGVVTDTDTETETRKACLLQLSAIHWEDVTDISFSTSLDGGEDDKLAEKLGVAHQHLFTEQHQRPAWNLVVLIHQDPLSHAISRVDLGFVSHHAIADGTSCAAFHKSLLTYWNQMQHEMATPSEWPYVVPQDLLRHPFMEEVFPFLLEKRDSPSQNIRSDKSCSLDPWTANLPCLPSMEDYVSYVKFITIPAAQVNEILSFCHGLKITLTGLLHSLIVIYLSKTIKEAHGFCGSTPVSLRRFTAITNDEIANYISCISHDWQDPLVSSARSCSEDAKDEQKIISEISLQFHAEVVQEVDNFLVAGAILFDRLSAIKDFDQYCQASLKTKRSTTYEVSNVGLVRLPQITEKDEVKLEKLVFTQSGNVFGEPIGCSVVSLADGPLTLALHWQDGALDEEVVHGLREYLDRRLSNICL